MDSRRKSFWMYAASFLTYRSSHSSDAFLVVPTKTTTRAPQIVGSSIMPPFDNKSSSRTRREGNRGSFLFLQIDDDNDNEDAKILVSSAPLVMHHTALRTRDITLAMQFYSLLGFEPTVKFRAGPARAAWLEQKRGDDFSSCSSSNHRLELIEVPSYILNEPEGTKKRALDLMARQELLGQNHFALDVTESIQQNEKLETLSDWMDELNKKSVQQFGKTLRVAVQPAQRLIGNSVFELAFLLDADGALVELLHKQNELQQEMTSGWEPWDGQGFVGGSDSSSSSPPPSSS